jgi:hypothetical protein
MTMTKCLLKTDADDEFERLADTQIDESCEAGQKIFARIRKSSKYFGQGGEGKFFAVVIMPGQYSVQANHNQYRLIDVDLFAEFGGEKTQITFEAK